MCGAEGTSTDLGRAWDNSCIHPWSHCNWYSAVRGKAMQQFQMVSGWYLILLAHYMYSTVHDVEPLPLSHSSIRKTQIGSRKMAEQSWTAILIPRTTQEHACCEFVSRQSTLDHRHRIVWREFVKKVCEGALVSLWASLFSTTDSRTVEHVQYMYMYMYVTAPNHCMSLVVCVSKGFAI